MYVHVRGRPCTSSRGTLMPISTLAKIVSTEAVVDTRTRWIEWQLRVDGGDALTVRSSRVIQACGHPGVSVAAVALSHGLSANLVRRWLSGRATARLPAVVAIQNCARPTRYSKQTKALNVQCAAPAQRRRRRAQDGPLGNAGSALGRGQRCRLCGPHSDRLSGRCASVATAHADEQQTFNRH